MDTCRGCRSKRSPTPGKKQTFFSLYGGPFCYFFSMGKALCYVFLFMRGFFSSYGDLFATFFFTWGAFLLRLPLGVGPFSHCGGLLLFFSLCGGLFCLHGGFYVFMSFFIGLPFPPMIYFAGACYYVTFIPCPPPSLTVAIMYPTKPTATLVFNSQ